MNEFKKENQMEHLESNATESEREAKYLRAKDRIAEVKEFYSKLMRSLVLIVFLAAINYYTNSWHFMWFLWAAFGIGIGLVFKALKIFGMNSALGRDWEARKIKEFMNEDEKQNRWN